LPMMTEAELENRMQVELGQYIPYNIEEVDVDYQIMDLVKERPNYMDDAFVKTPSGGYQLRIIDKIVI